MTTRKRSEDALRALCAHVHEDDGVDPRHDKDEDRKKADPRKDRQLCKQVLRALNDALQAEARSSMLRELTVVRVEPAPDIARLRVEIEASPEGAAVGARQLMEQLDRSRGFLRTQVAGAISRKRVPTLVFVIVPAREEEEHEHS